MREILAYGDSNTWGLIPGRTKERYPRNVRWTGVLENSLEDVRIAEEGLCGRTTVFEDQLRPDRRGVDTLPFLLESHYPVDGVILMLGTNDCKSFYNASPYTIGKGVELCLDEIEKYVSPDDILLVSPILLGEDVWRPEKDPEFDKRSVEVSKGLKKVYKDIAARRGIRFIAASDFASPSDIDSEHLSEEGHKSLAEAIGRVLFQ